MKNKSRLLLLSVAFAAGVFGVLLSTESVEPVSATVVDASVPIPALTVGRTRRRHRVSLFQALRNELDVRALDGLRVVTFDAPSGKVYLYLPDDMRAGDTISGTVKTEPKGQTPEERKKNLETLNGYTITLWPNPAPKKPGEGILRLPVKNPTFTFPLTPGTFDVTPGTIHSLTGLPGFNAELGPIRSSGGNFGPADAFPGIGSVVSGILPGVVIATTTAVPSDSFVVPLWGQQGRQLEIPGPFDGNFDNTTVRFGPVGSTVQDFEKNTENVSGGFGLIRPLAESPRKIVVESPTNVVGPIQVFVQEGDKKTTGTFRNLGVNLSAPKTNLMRGEKTTLTVEVRGLEGIKTDVPLQLDSKGVITMDQGNFQNLRIKPQEVTKDGRYTTNRTITGVQAGGFTVTATVIVRRFDFCLQDDSDPNRLFYFNSFTGDYLFACGGGSCRPGDSTGGTQTGGTTGKPGGTTQPGGTVQPGGTTPPGGTGTPPITPTGTTLTGTGKPAMKGCIITLSHNAPDRRVFARLDACTKTGDANVQTNSPKADIKITDKNTTDNTAASPPPK